MPKAAKDACAFVGGCGCLWVGVLGRVFYMFTAHTFVVTAVHVNELE